MDKKTKSAPTSNKIEESWLEEYLFDMSIPAECKNMNCGAIHEKPFK